MGLANDIGTGIGSFFGQGHATGDNTADTVKDGIDQAGQAIDQMNEQYQENRQSDADNAQEKMENGENFAGTNSFQHGYNQKLADGGGVIEAFGAGASEQMGAVGSFFGEVGDAAGKGLAAAGGAAKEGVDGVLNFMSDQASEFIDGVSNGYKEGYESTRNDKSADNAINSFANSKASSGASMDTSSAAVDTSQSKDLGREVQA